MFEILRQDLRIFKYSEAELIHMRVNVNYWKKEIMPFLNWSLNMDNVIQNYFSELPQDRTVVCYYNQWCGSALMLRGSGYT